MLNFFGGRLIGLNKKDDGARRIAIGFSLRRLASKCANRAAITRMTSILCPRQLGVGTPGGCEAAIHSAHRYLESMPEDHVLVKLDFSNAFNCLHRRDLLAVQQNLPDILYTLSATQHMLTPQTYFTVNIWFCLKKAHNKETL
jgi:hypothetical protein